MNFNLFRVYPKYKWALAFSDLIVLHISFIFSLFMVVKLKPHVWLMEGKFYDYEFYYNFCIYSVLCIFYFQYANMYKIQNIYDRPAHIFLIVKSLFFETVGFIVLQFLLFNMSHQPRMFYMIWFLSVTILMLLTRLPFVEIISRNTFIRDKVIIIGAGQRGRKLSDIFRDKIKFKEIIGYIDDTCVETYIDNIPVLGNVKDAPEIIKKHKVDYFILAEDHIKRDRFFEIFKFFQSNKLTLYVSSKYLKVLYEKLKLDNYDGFDSGMVRINSRKNNKMLVYAKRIFDIAASLTGIILFSPVFVFLALAVKLSSRGKIVYKQIRIGRQGKPFYFYKFRTMYVNSDKDAGRANNMEAFIKGNYLTEEGSLKIVNKSRITPIGHFLRKYSLDELPQLFNVLIGDMSLVGPRPCVLSEWKIYEDWQKQRLDFVPGCTGVWQVCGRSEVSFEDSVLMDIYYNQNHSLWFDIKIIFQTFSVIFSGRGGG